MSPAGLDSVAAADGVLVVPLGALVLVLLLVPLPQPATTMAVRATAARGRARVRRRMIVPFASGAYARVSRTAMSATLGSGRLTPGPRRVRRRQNPLSCGDWAPGPGFGAGH